MENHKKPLEPIAVGFSQGAEVLGIGLSTFKMLAATGKIATFYVGRRRLVKVAELHDFIERQTDKNA
jgi:excisionase family DNA binding protein